MDKEMFKQFKHPSFLILKYCRWCFLIWLGNLLIVLSCFRCDSEDIEKETPWEIPGISCSKHAGLSAPWTMAGAGSKMPLVWCQDVWTYRWVQYYQQQGALLPIQQCFCLAHPISDSLRSFKRFEPLTGKYWRFLGSEVPWSFWSFWSFLNMLVAILSSGIRHPENGPRHWNRHLRSLECKRPARLIPIFQNWRVLQNW